MATSANKVVIGTVVIGSVAQKMKSGEWQLKTFEASLAKILLIEGESFERWGL